VSARVIADRWFDGTRLHDEPVTIDVADGLIAHIHRGRAQRPESAGATYRAPFVMPGLINTHAHITRLGAFEPTEPISPGGMADTIARTLRSGITTVADMGSTLGMISSFQEHTAAHAGAGPDIRGAGPVVTAPGGYPLDWLPPLFRFLGVARTVSDERTAKEAVARLAADGADHVKVAIMHEGYDGQTLPALDVESTRAVVAEAHAQGLRVYAHAHSERDYLVALDGGVDALMHSSFTPLSPDTVRRIADSGTAVCPTLWVFESVCLGAEEGWHRDPLRIADLHPALVRSWRSFGEAYAASGDVMPEGMVGANQPKARVAESVRIASANLKLLVDSGVPIAFGNDASYGYSVIYRPHEELGAMVRAGMSTLDVLRAATAGAAHLLGLRDRGYLREGMRADLLLADAPQTDLKARDVLIGGAPVKAQRARGMLAAGRGLARTVGQSIRGLSRG